MSEPSPPAHVVSDETWQAVLDNGIAEGDAHSVDYYFYAESKPAAVSLAAHLEKQGSAPEVGMRRSGRLRLKREWAIIGASLPFALTQATLQAWVLSMDDLGTAQGVEFDGWGIPS